MATTTLETGSGLEKELSWLDICKMLKIDRKVRSTGVIVILCQHHKEKTPSLHMWEKSGRYYCHGCHMTGDKTDFCTRYSGWMPYVHMEQTVYAYMLKLAGEHPEQLMLRDL